MNKKRTLNPETGSSPMTGKVRKQRRPNGNNKTYIIYFIVAVVLLSFISFGNSSCNVYKFHDIATTDHDHLRVIDQGSGIAFFNIDKRNL
jgi:hypothetical protein